MNCEWSGLSWQSKWILIELCGCNDDAQMGLSTKFVRWYINNKVPLSITSIIPNWFHFLWNRTNRTKLIPLFSMLFQRFFNLLNDSDSDNHFSIVHLALYHDNGLSIDIEQYYTNGCMPAKIFITIKMAHRGLLTEGQSPHRSSVSDWATGSLSDGPKPNMRWE